MGIVLVLWVYNVRTSFACTDVFSCIHVFSNNKCSTGGTWGVKISIFSKRYAQNLDKLKAAGWKR